MATWTATDPPLDEWVLGYWVADDVYRVVRRQHLVSPATCTSRLVWVDDDDEYTPPDYWQPLPPPPMDGYHLTEVGHLASVARSVGVPVGAHPATELSAYHYVAPAQFVDEWTRRMAHEYGHPASDAGIRAAIEAHRRGDPLPPAEWADRPAWVPPSVALPPEDVLAYEPARRRGARA